MSTFPCRLYLPAPIGHACDVRVAMLESALAANDVAAVLYGPDTDISNRSSSLECAKTLMQCAIDHKAAFIVAEDVELAGEIGADGVHISGNIETYKQARSHLGADSIIGLSTALSRHHSMCAGETGANYIFFDPQVANDQSSEGTQSLADMITWWSGLFEVPCVAQAQSEAAENRTLINAGVDFLSLDDSLWTSQVDAGTTLKSLSRLIAECGRES